MVNNNKIMTVGVYYPDVQTGHSVFLVIACATPCNHYNLVNFINHKIASSHAAIIINMQTCNFSFPAKNFCMDDQTQLTLYRYLYIKYIQLTIIT